VIVNLVRAYEERNWTEYDNLLHEDFFFHFAQQDIDELGLPQSWNKTIDSGATNRMLSGENGVKPDGGLQDPVQTIDVVLMEPIEGSWAQSQDPEFRLKTRSGEEERRSGKSGKIHRIKRERFSTIDPHLQR